MYDQVSGYITNVRSGEWVHWKQLVVPYDYPEDSIPRYVGILVPNVDNVRTNFLINTISKQDKVRTQDINPCLHSTYY